jgi:tetratricopeptide (TPR) repeat protein
MGIFGKSSNARDNPMDDRTKRRISFGAVVLILAVVFIALGYVIKNLLANRNPGEVGWKENTPPAAKIDPDKDNVRNRLGETERILQVIRGRPPVDVRDDVQDWLSKMENIAQGYEDNGWWEQAAIILKRAVEIDSSYIHEPSSELSRRLMKNLGQCYIQSKKYELAQERFQQLIATQSFSRERGLPLAGAYSYLGDSLYFQHEWQKASEAYNSALNILDKDVTKSDVLSSNLPIKEERTLLTVSRLADCERNLAETNNDFYLKSASAYHVCAESWKLKDAGDPQNYAVSLYHFGQVGDHLPADQFETIQKNDKPDWILHKGKYYTVADLYDASISAIRNATVAKPQVLKPMLRGYSAYLLSKSNLPGASMALLESLVLPTN